MCFLFVFYLHLIAWKFQIPFHILPRALCTPVPGLFPKHSLQKYIYFLSFNVISLIFPETLDLNKEIFEF